MRSHFAVDWAFGVKGAIEAIVRREFPSQLRLWPTLQAFDFEAFRVGADYFAVILRDKISGIPSGPGNLQDFPYQDHPQLPLSELNVTEWLEYLITKFTLRTEDIALVLPIRDSGKNDAKADYALFSDLEKQLWNYQLVAGVTRQKSSLNLPVTDTPNPPQHITYNINGTNSRVNINSRDSSVNIVSGAAPEIFGQLLEAIRKVPADQKDVEAVAAVVQDMEAGYGTSGFLDLYTKFMGVLANHMQVFGPVVAPYLPVLARLLSN